MNMRKYASYKQAAKRIIRLMEKKAGGEVTGHKSENQRLQSPPEGGLYEPKKPGHGFSDYYFAKPENARKFEPDSGLVKWKEGFGAEAAHPYTYASGPGYVDPEKGTPGIISIPRWNTEVMPEIRDSLYPVWVATKPIESTEHQGLDRGPEAYQPKLTGISYELWPALQEAVRDQDIINKKTTGWWGSRYEGGDLPPAPAPNPIIHNNLGPAKKKSLWRRIFG